MRNFGDGGRVFSYRGFKSEGNRRDRLEAGLRSMEVFVEAKYDVFESDFS